MAFAMPLGYRLMQKDASCTTTRPAGISRCASSVGDHPNSLSGMGRALLIIDMQEVLVPVVWRDEELADRIAGWCNRPVSNRM